MKPDAVFVRYADELSSVHAENLAEIVAGWVKMHGIKTEGIRWQHDGDGEFIGGWKAKEKSGFIKTIES